MTKYNRTLTKIKSDNSDQGAAAVTSGERFGENPGAVSENVCYISSKHFIFLFLIFFAKSSGSHVASKEAKVCRKHWMS